MFKKVYALLALAMVAGAAQAAELGSGIESEERWSVGTGASAIELRSLQGEAQSERVLFINRSDAAIDIVDMNMTRIRTIKPSSSVDITDSVANDEHVAISIGDGHVIYLELRPGTTVIARNAKEEQS